MIELIQCPWSPYCLVQQRILDYSGAPFRVVNVPSGDRSKVWQITKQRYYQVPVLRDKATAIFETGDNSQVIAKYLDSRLDLDLFPRQWEGIQELIWPYIENDLEGIGFKLNDIYWREFVELSDQLRFLRHKERKFGRGCIDQWKRNQKELLKEFGDKLLPFEKMLSSRPFLLDQHPRFVDFNLYGIIANVLFTRHYRLPARHKRLTEWYGRIKLVRH